MIPNCVPPTRIFLWATEVNCFLYISFLGNSNSRCLKLLIIFLKLGHPLRFHISVFVINIYLLLQARNGGRTTIVNPSSLPGISNPYAYISRKSSTSLHYNTITLAQATNSTLSSLMHSADTDLLIKSDYVPFLLKTTHGLLTFEGDFFFFSFVF